MPTRDIIHIDRDKCDGCGLCISACHEGALQLVEGKAELVSDMYCDGLGDCLKECPQGAIEIIKRDADDYDEMAVEERLAELGRPPLKAHGKAEPVGGGCPGSQAKPLAPLAPMTGGCPGSAAKAMSPATPAPVSDRAGFEGQGGSDLTSWPVQLRLLNPAAPHVAEADLLLVADCAPLAVKDFHERFLKGRIPIMACPKLDPAGENVQRLADLCATARPASITLVRMHVPCCGGLAMQLEKAQAIAGTAIPVQTVVAMPDGRCSTMN